MTQSPPPSDAGQNIHLQHQHRLPSFAPRTQTASTMCALQRARCDKQPPHSINFPPLWNARSLCMNNTYQHTDACMEARTRHGQWQCYMTTRHCLQGTAREHFHDAWAQRKSRIAAVAPLRAVAAEPWRAGCVAIRPRRLRRRAPRRRKAAALHACDVGAAHAPGARNTTHVEAH